MCMVNSEEVQVSWSEWREIFKDGIYTFTFSNPWEKIPLGLTPKEIEKRFRSLDVWANARVVREDLFRGTAGYLPLS